MKDKEGVEYWHAKCLPDVYTALMGEGEYKGKPIADYTRAELVAIVDGLPEFKAEVSALMRLIEREFDFYGARCQSLVTFHCELNPIELVWAWVNRIIDPKKDSTRDTLVKELTGVLKSNISPDLARGWFAHCDVFYLLYGQFRLGGSQVHMCALVNKLSGHGGPGHAVSSKRKVVSILGTGETGVPGALPAFASNVQAAVDVEMPVYTDDHEATCYACRRDVTVGPDALHCRCCSATIHTASRCLGARIPDETGWACGSCQTRIDAARVRVVTESIATGDLATPLVGTDPSEEEELEVDHAIAVMVGSRHSLRIITARLARGTRGRRALVAVIQRIEGDCLASENQYSFRLLLAAAPAGGCCIIYRGK